MALSTDDRMAIYELIALHGHLMDAGEFDRLGELSTEDDDDDGDDRVEVRDGDTNMIETSYP